MKTLKIYLILMLTTAPLAAWSQWSSDSAINTVLPGSLPANLSPEMISDGSGGVILSWNSNAGIDESDLVVQKVDSAGYLVWGFYGITISPGGGWMALLSDGDGGCIVTWIKNLGAPNDFSLMAQHIASDGALLWNPAGIVVWSGTIASQGISPDIISDGNGGAIIAWAHDDAGVSDIYVQRIDAAGTVLWNPAGTVVCAAPSFQQFPRMASDGSGGVFVIWPDFRMENEPIHLYAQRVDTNGTVQWATDGILISDAVNVAPPHQSLMPKISGIDGGAVISWIDADASGIGSLRCQKINLDGQAAWMENGIEVFPATDAPHFHSMITDFNGNTMVSIVINQNVVVQRLDGSGQLQWNSGITYGNPAFFNDVPFLTTDSDGNTLITWMQNADENEEIDIYAQKLNYSGASLWANNGVPVSTAPMLQYDPAIISDGAGGAVVAFSDIRFLPEESQNLAIQNICSDGMLGQCALAADEYDKKADITVTPNPSDGEFTITAPMVLDQIIVTDALGQTVYTTVPTEAALDIQIHAVAAGVYFVRMISDTHETVKKLIIRY